MTASETRHELHKHWLVSRREQPRLSDDEKKRFALILFTNLFSRWIKIWHFVNDQTTWHSIRVPPDCTKSSTITTCLPAGLPSLSRTILLSPSRTFAQTTCYHKQSHQSSDKFWMINKDDKLTIGKCCNCLWNLFQAPSSGKAIVTWWIWKKA